MNVEPLSQSVFSVQWDSKQKTVAACYADGEIRLFKDSGENFKAINYVKKKASEVDPLASITNEELRMPMTCMRWQSNNPKVLITASPFDNGLVQFWNTDDGSKISEIVEEKNKTECIDVAKKGTIFATGGTDRRVRIYDAAKECRTLAFRDDMVGQDLGHSSKVTAIRFHPTDANIMVTCGWERLINVWDLRTDAPVKSCSGPMVCSEALDVGHHGLELITGSTNPKESLQIWDLMNSKEMELKATVRYDDVDDRLSECWQVQTCRFSGLSNLIIAGGTGEYGLRIYDRKTGRPIAEYAHVCPITCMDINYDHNRLLFGDSLGNITAVDVSSVMAQESLRLAK